MHHRRFLHGPMETPRVEDFEGGNEGIVSGMDGRPAIDHELGDQEAVSPSHAGQPNVEQ